MDFLVIIAYIVGVLLVYSIGKALVVPLRVLFNIIVNAVIGGGILLVINFIGGFWDFGIGINPVTALVVGLLGIPGVALLIALRLIV